MIGVSKKRIVLSLIIVLILVIGSIIGVNYNKDNVELFINNKKYGEINRYEYFFTKKLKVPTKKGYKFVGWSLDKYGNHIIKNGDKLNGIKKLYAIFNKKVYKLTIDPDDGEFKDSTSDYTLNLEYGEDYKLDDASKKGYVFKGWKSLDSDTKVLNHTLTMGDGNTTIKAKYEKENFIVSVIFDEDNSTFYSISLDEYIDLPIKSKKGYTFAGYDVSGGKIIDNKFYPSDSKNVSIKYKWVKNAASNSNEYILKYYLMNTDGKDYSLYNTVIKKGNLENILDNSIKSFDGFTFKKSKINGKEINLMYSRNKYNINVFDGNKNYVINDYYEKEVSLNTPSKDYYNFVGWNNKDIINNKIRVSSNDISISAKFEPIEYKISYILNGGSLDNKITSYNVESSDVIKEAYKDNYDFVGYKVNNSDKTYKIIKLSDYHGNLSLEAIFEDKKYTLSIHTSDNKVITKRVTLNDEFTSKSNIILDGYYIKKFVDKDNNEVKFPIKMDIDKEIYSISYPLLTTVIENDTLNTKADNTLDNNIRYVGENPNNYIKFNNETWRIIGSFNEDKKYAKIINTNSIGMYSYNSSVKDVNAGFGVNNFNNSDSYNLLNDLYLNKKSGNCYNGYDKTSKTCDFTSNGISDTYLKYILKATWYSGNNNQDYMVDDNGNASKFYEYEKGEALKGCSKSNLCNDDITRDSHFKSYVGLALVSDIGFASSDDICRNISINSWWNNGCLKNNYLLLDKMYLLDSYNHKAYGYRVFMFDNDLLTVASSLPYNIYPTLYLVDNTYVKDGNGTLDNPYIIDVVGV